MNTENHKCYLCGCYVEYPDTHHCLHGTANRRIADREGLYVYLCQNCHTLGDKAVHRVPEIDRRLEREAQEVWEERYRSVVNPEGDARAEWMRLFGKNYIYD